MRILVLGAGGTGGYFGGRLAQSGADVTFLVRKPRAAQLDARGLQLRSPLGDADFPVAHVVAEDLATLVRERPFDLVVLSCKAYDLDGSIDAIAPAVGENTAVLPILNVLLHYQALDERFGRERVLGGLCFISAAKGPQGEILHLARPASITFGERNRRGISARVAAFAALCEKAGIEHKASEDIALDQWIKFAFLATLAAGTCLMRGSVGEIVSGEGGADFLRALYAETLAVSAAAGQPIPEKAQAIARTAFADANSDTKASMLRDLESGQRVEAAHIVGDMVHRARAAGLATPRLDAAWVHLQVYEAQRRD
jgi:2-dehydropantoate 2-reductase